MTKKEVLKSWKMNLPIKANFLQRLSSADTRNTKHSYIENVAFEMQSLIEEIEFVSTTAIRPTNFEVKRNVADGALPKRFLTSRQLKFITENMLEENYHDHYKLFTDASKTESATGIGITDLRTVQLSIGINNKIQITNAELVAILRAIRLISTATVEEAVILTDSAEGCRLLDVGDPDNYIVNLIWSEIGTFDSTRVTIQWIPCHCGTISNEEADVHANAGCYDELPREIPITVGDASLIIKNEAMVEWQELYEALSVHKGNHHWKIQREVARKPWFHDLQFNTNEIRIITRLRTGHGLCGVKKHLFKLRDTYFCMECED